MEIEELRRRQAISTEQAMRASCVEAKMAHAALAKEYGLCIAVLEAASPRSDTVDQIIGIEAVPFAPVVPTVRTLSTQASKRECLIIDHAFEKLGAKGAQAFLNGPHSFLDGNPLQMALASDEGAAVVREAIDFHAATHTDQDEPI